ncbi:MAG: YdcF family protein [Nitrospiraceae bacterium]
MEVSPILFAGYKILKYLLYPVSWIVAPIVLATGIALLPYSPRRFQFLRLLLLLSTVLTFLLATPIPGRTLLAVLEGWYPPFQPSTTTFDAIVVLAGGIYPQGSLRPQPELSEQSRLRTVCGAELFNQGLAPKVILAGGDASLFGHGPSEAGEMKRFATRLGVTDMAIITEEQSRNTYENAVNVRRLVNHESILLVTSAYHLPRAVAIFAKQGFHVTPAPCGYETKDRPGEGLDQINVTDFLPSYHALETTTHAVDELAGIVVYWMTGAL